MRHENEVRTVRVDAWSGVRGTAVLFLVMLGTAAISTAQNETRILAIGDSWVRGHGTKYPYSYWYYSTDAGANVEECDKFGWTREPNRTEFDDMIGFRHQLWSLLKPWGSFRFVGPHSDGRSYQFLTPDDVARADEWAFHGGVPGVTSTQLASIIASPSWTSRLVGAVRRYYPPDWLNFAGGNNPLGQPVPAIKPVDIVLIYVGTNDPQAIDPSGVATGIRDILSYVFATLENRPFYHAPIYLHRGSHGQPIKVFIAHIFGTNNCSESPSERFALFNKAVSQTVSSSMFEYERKAGLIQIVDLPNRTRAHNYCFSMNKVDPAGRATPCTRWDDTGVFSNCDDLHPVDDAYRRIGTAWFEALRDAQVVSVSSTLARRIPFFGIGK